MRCTVVGAGVIGLSCAWRLAEDGHEVTVVSDQAPADTTSAVAAALWYPYLAAPRDSVLAWGAATYDVLRSLAADEPASAVRLSRGHELFDATQRDPWWASAVPDLERMVGGRLPAGVVDGWTFTAPLIDMPHYLAWLEARLSGMGVRLTTRRVVDLGDELAQADAVINCGGLRAGQLVEDPTVTPVRGQVVVLSNPGITEWWLHDREPDELTYVIPRLDTVILGGTAQPGRDDLEPDPETAAAVLERGVALVPELASAQVLAHRVGLRPARPTVRLEAEDTPAGRVIHCYGHGGAGVTLSWGCAADVAALVRG